MNEFERLGVEAGVVCRDLNSAAGHANSAAVVKAAALKAVLYARTATYVLHRTSGTHQSQGGNRPILHTHKDSYISNTSSDSIFSPPFSFSNAAALAVSIFSRCARAVDDQINMELGV